MGGFGIISFALSASSARAILENDTARKRQGKQNSQISERETPVGVEAGSTLASDPSGDFEQDKGLNIRV